MRVAHGAAHLTYCTNIHPGETLAEVRDNIERYVAPVKARVCPDAPFGVGLRLSAGAAEELQAPAALTDFAALLESRGLYVFTINGFPYGAFHGTRVKENVYRPDWRSARRGEYSSKLAEILARLLPQGVTGSVSTVPGAFRDDVRTAGDREQIVEQLLVHAATLVRLRETTGKEIALALEPEPACFLETTEEATRFFEESLFARSARARFASLTGQNHSQAEVSLRRHLGVCFDACHAAVEFEVPRASIAALENAGIKIAKLQISSALSMQVLGSRRSEIARFADDVYLHQVVIERNGQFERYLDLPRALAEGVDGEWRIHFHVPVFQRAFGVFESTQAHLREVLSLVRERGVSTHLEIETYTWDVLPEAFRSVDVISAIAREFEWTCAEIERPST